jgi:hypothetical protein
MRKILFAMCALLAAAGTVLAAPAIQINSKENVLAWINAFDPQRDFARAPSVMKSASDFGALTDPESAGMYVGFMAGLIGGRPDKAGTTIDKLLAIRSPDHWAIVRAIAYSGHPDWRGLMEKYRPKMPTRDLMAQRFLEGKLPTFDTPPAPKASWTKKANPVNWFKKKEEEDVTPLNERADVVDVHWGMYFAMRNEQPLNRMVELLPWSEDRDSFERLTIGSMVKYTLAMNASRDSKLLGRLKAIHAALPDKPKKEKETDPKPHLAKAIEAAETVEIALLRRDALGRMEDLKRMGPGYKRDVAWWGKVGQGVLSLGCMGAAVAGAVAVGLPCVIGGAASSAALNFWASPG